MDSKDTLNTSPLSVSSQGNDWDEALQALLDFAEAGKT